jgi:hypothetical protein
MSGENLDGKFDGTIEEFSSVFENFSETVFSDGM